jgi:hypothetical protein
MVLAVAVGNQMRLNPDAFDLALEQASNPIAGLDRKELKLDAGRAGIEDEDRVHGHRLMPTGW